MGALARATELEIEEIVSGDANWWRDVLGKVALDGLPALREEARLRGWTWDATWSWVCGDDRRQKELRGSLNAKAQLLGWGTEGIAASATPEDVAVRKLQVDTAFRLAGKVDRLGWGEKVDHIGIVLDPLSEMLREISERRLAAMRGLTERVTEGEIVAPAAAELEEI